MNIQVSAAEKFEKKPCSTSYMPASNVSWIDELSHIIYASFTAITILDILIPRAVEPAIAPTNITTTNLQT